MSTDTITPVQDLMYRAMEVYNFITGDLTLYVDDYGYMTADKSEFEPEDEFYEVDAYLYIAQAITYDFERDELGNIVKAFVWVDHSPSTKIDLLNNKITSYYGGNIVSIKFAPRDVKIDLLQELADLYEA